MPRNVCLRLGEGPSWIDVVLDGALFSPIALAPHLQERPVLGSEVAPRQEQLLCVQAVTSRFCAASTTQQLQLQFHDGAQCKLGNASCAHSCAVTETNAPTAQPRHEVFHMVREARLHC